jgi:hypothetical protein
MRPWVLTRPYLNKYCLVSRPVECLHGPQVPSGALELLVALLVQTQHITDETIRNLQTRNQTDRNLRETKNGTHRKPRVGASIGGGKPWVNRFRDPKTNTANSRSQSRTNSELLRFEMTTVSSDNLIFIGGSAYIPSTPFCRIEACTLMCRVALSQL